MCVSSEARGEALEASNIRAATTATATASLLNGVAFCHLEVVESRKKRKEKEKQSWFGTI
jgi:hypothetical protein